jgi:hypothetical protein
MFEFLGNLFENFENPFVKLLFDMPSPTEAI